MKQKTKFLDYEIVNSGNSDGFVITKPDGELWEGHLGNYSTLESAKEYCVRYFMIARPNEFSAQICARMTGTQIYMDYYKFVHVLETEGIKQPEEILCSNDENCTLSFKNKEI